jgi:hypothetical protein
MVQHLILAVPVPYRLLLLCSGFRGAAPTRGDLRTSPW